MKRRKLLNAKDEPSVEPRPCDVAGCEAEAAFRAPHSRDRMSESRWFCLDHARAYNAAWDFFAGMSQSDIERYQKDDVTGHRPTWPFGLGPIGVAAMDEMLGSHLRDAVGAFAKRARPKAPEPKVPPEQRSALAKLNLGPGSTLKEIKQRYKELVKRYHPDLNGGDRGGEDQMKDVNEAYRTLVRARTA
ncbi:MAG: molecular chaperone DnaJ [Alphaproteobacteria bacterium]|nr:molecular chaperone DnaJ [Alphaproteobacteria bacterium]